MCGVFIPSLPISTCVCDAGLTAGPVPGTTRSFVVVWGARRGPLRMNEHEHRPNKGNNAFQESMVSHPLADAV